VKKLILLAAAIVVTVVAFAVTPGPSGFRKTVALSWDYDTNNAPDAFKLYSSTNIGLPATNWPLVATVSGNVQNITISNITAQQMWFYVTASNWWGESLPSNTAGTPQPPGSVINLRIGP